MPQENEKPLTRPDLVDFVTLPPGSKILGIAETLAGPVIATTEGVYIVKKGRLQKLIATQPQVLETQFKLPLDAFEKFVQACEEPAKPTEELRKLFAEHPKNFKSEGEA